MPWGRAHRLRRSTLEAFARDPVGQYLAGNTWAHFCAVPTLWGLLLWGRPDGGDAAELGRSLVLELRPPAVPHASIIDASRLESGDPAAFRAAEGYLQRYGDRLAAQVTRVALIRPRGLSGAIVAGAYQVLPRPYPVAVFDEPVTAMRWLAGAQARSWPAPQLLAELFAEASGTPPFVGRLRAWLDGHLCDPTLAGAARALGMSARTLQRRLSDAQTTLQEEVADARVRAAARMLLEGDAALTTIALDVGCASPQHFSALFKKRTGESPSSYRTRMRPKG